MLILAVDSTAKSASAALSENGKVISECFSDAGLTHSRTLMPMVDSVIRAADRHIGDVDIFALTAGPGSFTGVRIGAAAIKGMAAATGKPCFALSTLEATAWGFAGFACTLVCAMDARCNQVYCAVFRSQEGRIVRLSPDEAVSIPELVSKLEDICSSDGDMPLYIAGDAAQLVYAQRGSVPLKLPPVALGTLHAGSAALAAYEKISAGEPCVSANDLVPTYLRMPQAERELKKKQALNAECEADKT